MLAFISMGPMYANNDPGLAPLVLLIGFVLTVFIIGMIRGKINGRW
jgi:hypothetical protein